MSTSILDAGEETILACCPGCHWRRIGLTTSDEVALRRALFHHLKDEHGVEMSSTRETLRRWMQRNGALA